MIYKKLPVVFLTTLASEKEDSTNSHIARYILSHRDEIKDLSVKEMADRCAVGTGSISRFCRAVGLKDFNELKILLEEDYQEFQLHDTSDLKVHYLNEVYNRLKQVCDSVDMDQIKRLCDDLKSYDSVGILGLLKSGGIALNMQSDLLMLGKHVFSHINFHEQIRYLENTDQNDLIIIFSYTGSYFDYTEIRSLRKILKKPKIWLIAGKHTTYPDYVDEVILFDSTLDRIGHPYQLQFIENLIVQEYAGTL